MLRLLLILAAGGGLAYILLARRRTDLFTLAIVSALLYGIPAIVGFTFYPGSGNERPIVAVGDLTQGIVLAVLVATVAGALCSDWMAVRVVPADGADQAARLAVGMLLVLAYSCAGLTVLTGGHQLMSTDKLEVLGALTRWYKVAVAAAVVGVTIAVAAGRRGWALLFVPLFVADFIVGFRVNLVWAALGIAMCWAVPWARQILLLRRPWTVLVGALALSLIVVGPHLRTKVRTGQNPGELASPSELQRVLMSAEPFTTVAVLDAVGSTNFRVPPAHIIGALAGAVPFYSDVFGPAKSFNDRFQESLFGKLGGHGVASSFWAEAWSCGGAMLFLIYLSGFIAALLLCNTWLLSARPLTRAFGAVAGSLLAFYVHRNDLGYLLNLERNVCLMFLGCWLAAVALRSLDTRRRPRESVRLAS